MSDSYIGEVRLVGFNYAPYGWAPCDGRLLAISDDNPLYSIIGTTYGGNGQSNFAVPDLRGRIPIHQGSNGTNNYAMGQMGGAESVTLAVSQYPSHTHNLMASSNSAGSSTPGNATVGVGPTAYISRAPTTAMNANMVGPSGGGNQPHENRQVFQVLNWVISLQGIFPPPS